MVKVMICSLDTDGIVSIAPEQLVKLIKEAYNQGYEDGKSNKSSCVSYTHLGDPYTITASPNTYSISVSASNNGDASSSVTRKQDVPFTYTNNESHKTGSLHQ